MESFIRLGILLLSVLLFHYEEDTGSVSGTEDRQTRDSILGFILTKKRPNPDETGKTAEHIAASNLNKGYDTLNRFPTAHNSSHPQGDKGRGLRCNTTHCSIRGGIFVQANKPDMKAPRWFQRRANGAFLSKAMGILDDSNPMFARQAIYYNKAKNATKPSSQTASRNITTSNRPNEKKRKYDRMHGQGRLGIGWKRPGPGGYRPNLGNILPLLSDQGQHGPMPKPTPIHHYQPGAIHLMLRPGNGPPKFQLLKPIHRNPYKKQVRILERNTKHGHLDFLGPHIGAGGLGALQMSTHKSQQDDLMETGLAGGTASQMQIHVNSPTVIHHKGFPLGFPFNLNAGSVAGRPLGVHTHLPFHHFEPPIPAFPVPMHFHPSHAQRIPIPMLFQSPPRIERVGYPIPVPVPGPPVPRPFVIPMRVPSPPKIERVPFAVPVRMRPEIQHIPYPVPVSVPSKPQIKHVPYPVPVPVKQPPQIEKFFYPIQIPQPAQIHHVPFPVYIRSRPQIKHVPVPVPSPPERITVAVPGPIRYMINKVPYPVIVPRIQNVPFPVAVNLRQNEDDDFDEEMYLPDSSRGTYAIPRISAMNRYSQEYAQGRGPMPVLIKGQCLINPCLSGGTCTAHLDTYRCHCTNGYKGIHCEEQVSCQPNPCKNFGSCTDIEKGFECTCKKGYTGKYCSKSDACYPSPCSNGGTCVQTGNIYSCSCHLGWMGKNCEVESKCLPLNPCQNGGTCSEGDSSYKCDCTPGWKGISCEITAPETMLDVTEQPEACAACHDHAICTSGRCSCKPGYNGDGFSCKSVNSI